MLVIHQYQHVRDTDRCTAVVAVLGGRLVFGSATMDAENCGRTVDSVPGRVQEDGRGQLVTARL